MKRWFVTCLVLLVAATLAACNSAGDVLQPTAADRKAAGASQSAASTAPGSPQSVTIPPAAATLPPAGATTTPSTTVKTQTSQAQTSQAQTSQPKTGAPAIGKVRLQIAPLVGASVEAAGPLTERLNLQARQRGISLVGSTDAAATNVLKGYFSVLTEGKNTTVVYVWDLYDMAGNRLHRINGQQSAPSSAGKEGWAAVPASTMQAIADATMDQLAGWLSGKSG